MIVYKFGGISVKSADAVKNVAVIINSIDDNIVVVISAMGKMTNKLEDLINSYFSNKSDLSKKLEIIKQFHIDIIEQLFEKDHIVYSKFNNLLTELESKLATQSSKNYDFEYDKIISYGELFSTVIISEYLNSQNIKNQFIDIRKSVITDGYYRDGRIIWNETETNIKNIFNFKDTNKYLTQGFIASDNKENTVTLGREGSDFSASIIAFCLNAEYVTIWKDVSGILNADPRIFANTKKIDKLSYKECVELAYYGAQVIHPKTIKPLENKNIPLYVKSFQNYEKAGSVISNFKEKINYEPIIIINQLESLKIKVNLMENSAVSFSIVIDNTIKADKLIYLLENDFKVRYNTDLQLITIRYYNKNIIKELLQNKKVLVEQKTRSTARYTVKN
jgi:aspartate kinase